MQIDVMLTEEELRAAIRDYCIKIGILNDEFQLIKDYTGIRSYTYSNDKGEIDDNKLRITE